MFNINELFPKAVAVTLEEINPGDTLIVSENVGEVDHGIFDIVVNRVEINRDRFTSSGGLSYGREEYLFYRLPPELPIATGSIILKPSTKSYRYASGTLTSRGWYLTRESGLEPRHVASEEILSIGEVLYDAGA